MHQHLVNVENLSDEQIIIQRLSGRKLTITLTPTSERSCEITCLDEDGDLVEPTSVFYPTFVAATQAFSIRYAASDIVSNLCGFISRKRYECNVWPEWR